ncbi:hypothetical protein [Streptomyces sp. L2]|uniref:hypothetical protein n=1 Tax=Streptomyces sp. L2 TaxID=2162665 RepID=UPI001010E77A|nr:hypothetical protein [Streptomyces sp. L2]
MTAESLLEATNMLRSPAYWTSFEGFERHDWMRLLLDTLKSMTAAPDGEPPMTPFVDGEVKPALIPEIHAPKLLAASTLEEFLKLWLGGERFYVSVSHLSAWNERLHDLAHEAFARPLSSAEGVVGGLDVYAVLGNVGATPFGIHQDDEAIFLAHCGPNPKEIWYSDTAPAGSDASAAEEWMAQATHHVMRTGDVAFMPAGIHHLLRSSGFGVSLGFDVFPPDSTTSPDRQRALRSNGYLLSPPARPSAGAPGDADAVEFVAPGGSRPEWRSEQGGRIAAFLRGRQVILPDTPWMPDALHLLGRPQGFSRHELAAITGAPETAQQILSLALDLRAVRPVAVHGA